MGNTAAKEKLNDILNKAIVTESEDVEFLNNLLNIKLSISRDSTQSQKLDFCPTFILHKNIDFNIVIDVLDKTSQVCNNNQKLLKSLATYIINTQEYNLINHHIFDSFAESKKVKLLNFLIVVSTKYNLNPLLLEVIKPEFVFKFLLKVLADLRTPFETHQLGYQTIISYFKLCTKPIQIECINAVYKYCSDKNNLDLICALLNHIDDEFFYTHSCCFTDNTFWIHIESCISGKISHLQKQGIHILMKYISSNTAFNKNKDIFHSSDTETAWQTFFILIDVGREKQIHLVEPSINLLKHIYNLPFLWQKCCYKIFLQHSQLTIVYQVVITIFKRVFENNDHLREILKLALPAINRNEYSILSCKVFKNFSQFSHSITTEQFQVVLEEIAAMFSWNPVSFWKVLQSVFSNMTGRQKQVSSEVIERILLCANNLTHVYIRNECIKFIVTSVWSVTNQKLNHKILEILMTWNNALPISYYVPPKVSLSRMFFDADSEQIRLHEKLWLCILQDSQANNNWPHFKDKMNCLYFNSHYELIATRDFLMQDNSEKFQSTSTYSRIEIFLLNYFKENLQDDSTHMFINCFKLLFKKCKINDHVFKEIIEKPLFHHSLYNKCQIYVALVLVQDYLFGQTWYMKTAKGNQKFPVNFKVFFQTGHYCNISICFVKLDDKTIRSCIKVDNPLLGIECVKLIYKLALKRGFTAEVTGKTIEQFKILLETQCNQAINQIYIKTHQLLSQITLSPDVVKTLIAGFVSKNLYENVLRLNRDRYYKDIICKFIKIVCSENYLKYNTEKMDKIYGTLLDISHQYPQVRFAFIKALNSLVISRKDNLHILLIADIYLQGIIVTKDERTEFSICQEFIDGLTHTDVNQIPAEKVNPNSFEVAARILALGTLIFVGENEATTIINCLQLKYKEHFNKRYFQDSKIHFEKLRLLQAILLLTAHANLDLSQKESLYLFALECIEHESNQNCIMQILNMILIGTLNDPTTVISWISKFNPVPPTLMANLIPTLLHLTLLSGERTFEETIQLILPWTMGAQFKARVYAQYCVKQIMDHAAKREYKDILNKYWYLRDCINNCITVSGDSFEITLKSDIILLRDYNPLQDRQWSVVLYDIPRLNKVSLTEWKNVKLILLNLNIFGKFYKNELAKFPMCTDLSKAVDSYLKACNSVSDVGTQEQAISEISHIQKKIVPWKSALENKDDDAAKSCDFILVASLIDKPQNLGGLSRTCEVFGLNRMVFNDAKIITDKEFKSLSMSSESRIVPTEVKITDLWDYILTLRKEGYKLIGAEQTTGSENLNSFKFPKKMALILGNEKTGIPPNLIPLLDNCVEIPQFGHTRSLNVHVAGAMFIWEYAKQHLIQDR